MVPEHITPDIYRAICVLFGVLLGFIVAFRVRLYRSTYERQLCDLTAGLRLLEGKVKTVVEISTDHSESLAMHDETLEAHGRRITAMEDTIIDSPWSLLVGRQVADTEPSPKALSVRPRCEGCNREGGDPQCYGARCGHCGGRMIVLDPPEGPTAA